MSGGGMSRPVMSTQATLGNGTLPNTHARTSQAAPAEDLVQQDLEQQARHAEPAVSATQDESEEAPCHESAAALPDHQTHTRTDHTRTDARAWPPDADAAI